MSILIVSTNPLFKEVIAATVVQIPTELIEVGPEDALDKIRELRPDVIIIDETVKTSTFEDLLARVRDLEKTRIIFLNPAQNEIVLMDSRRKTLKRVNDLIEAIASSGYEIHSEIKDREITDVSEVEKDLKGNP